MKLKEYKLGDLIEVTRGMSLPGEFYSTEGEYIRLTCGNFDYVNNSFKENKSKDDLYYVGKIKPEFIMEKGDIITPLTEQAIGLLGSTAIIPESGKYIQSQDVAKVTCKKGMIDHDFAYYLIPSKCVKEQLSAAAQQTKIRHTSPDAIKACKVFVPPLSEQKKIASVLSALDDKIALNKKMNQKLEAMAKRLYDYWFVQYDFPDKNGHPYKTTGGPMTYNPTLKREIPEGWEVKRLGDSVEILKDGTHNPPARIERGIPLLTGTMFGNNFLDYTKATYISNEDYLAIHSKYQPLENDIIITKIGTLGNVNILRDSDIPIAIHCNSALLRFKKSFGSYYPFFFCKSDLFQLRLKSVKGQSIQEFASLDKIASVLCEIPKDETLKSFNSIVEPIMKQLIRISKEITHLTTLRDRLLPLLMTGQIEV